MTEKTKAAIRVLVDAILEEKPGCESADIHIENGTVRMTTLQLEAVSVVSYKTDYLRA